MTRHPTFDTYSPGRRDARIGEARAFVLGARHTRNLTALAIESQFNLKPEMAARMLPVWIAEREAASG